MAITGGFGTTMDLERGTARKWVMGRDGVKRWADTNEPVEPTCPKCGCGGVLNTANADGGRASEWTCWAWQCRHVWVTPNANVTGLAPAQEIDK